MIKALLKDCSVLICRPEPAASELGKALTAVGASCKVLPCLKIQSVELDAEQRQSIIDLDAYQHIIVTSQHAAQRLLEEVDAYWPQLPVKQSWHAIGQQTWQLLAAQVTGIKRPEGDLDSETLLALDAFKDVRGKKILIAKGQGGRQTIQQQLRNRGARVDIVELYRREPAVYSDQELNETFRPDYPGFIVCLSGETLANLLLLSSQANVDLSQSKFILPSKRVESIAKEHGLDLTYVTESLRPIDIIKCIARAKTSTRN